jgi:hypothetical protein
MHRVLKELESVRAYIAVIERALMLRCVHGLLLLLTHPRI